MMLKNATSKKVLAGKVKVCDSVLSKAVGLMFRRKIMDEAYLFTFPRAQRVSLHMLFVLFPIDVLFLDDEKRVVEIKENFRPFTFYFPKRKAKYVIELPAGRAEGTKVGDRIEFQR